MHAPEHHLRIQSVLLAAAAFVVVVAGLRAASALVNPFLLAVFIAVISTPLIFWLEARRIPRGVALFAVILAVVGVLFGLSVVVGASVNDFTNDLPRYTERLKGQFGSLVETLRGLGIDLPQDRDGVLRPRQPRLGPRARRPDLFNGFGVVLANAFLILLTVVFILLEASTFSGKLHAIARDAHLTRASVDAFMGTVRRYLAIKSLMSLGTGAAVWIWLTLLGVDYPVLWGLLAFLLNYVPNIGSIIAAVPAVLLALVQLGPAAAAWSAAGYLAINVVFGNVLEPRFMGRGVGLSPLVVFLSLIFWGWVLGPVGMFLSVPLTITAKIALAASDETRWAAVLLGTGGEAASGAGTEPAARPGSEEAGNAKATDAADDAKADDAKADDAKANDGGRRIGTLMCGRDRSSGPGPGPGRQGPRHPSGGQAFGFSLRGGARACDECGPVRQ